MARQQLFAARCIRVLLMIGWILGLAKVVLNGLCFADANPKSCFVKPKHNQVHLRFQEHADSLMIELS